MILKARRLNEIMTGLHHMTIPSLCLAFPAWRSPALLDAREASACVWRRQGRTRRRVLPRRRSWKARRLNKTRRTLHLGYCGVSLLCYPARGSRAGDKALLCVAFRVIRARTRFGGGLARASSEEALHGHEQQRHDEDGQHSGRERAADDAGADGHAAVGAGA